MIEALKEFEFTKDMLVAIVVLIAMIAVKGNAGQLWVRRGR